MRTRTSALPAEWRLLISEGEHLSEKLSRTQSTGPYERSEREIGDTWLEFRVAKESLKLRERAVANIGSYQVYSERAWEPGVPGVDQCVSISVAGDSAVELAALRGAILILNGDERITRWDCTERVGPI